MAIPEFFDKVPSITLHDPLSQLLGSSDTGLIEYRYEEAAKLAGHSCPTVAGAWLSAVKGVQALYPDETPERGGMSVYLPSPETEGVTGVIGQILTFVTGAAANNGFHGLGGGHKRSNLLHYETEGVQGVRIKRNDNGKMVEVLYNPQAVSGHPEQPALASAVLSGTANDEQKQRFGQVWQDRVRRILLEHTEDDAMIRVIPIEK